MLEAAGFEVVVGELEDGSDCIEAVQEASADVVLLDVQLPDEDGFQVARKLAISMSAALSCSCPAATGHTPSTWSR